MRPELQSRRWVPIPAARFASPGAFCGVVGLKPTYGRVSRYGLIAFASSLDHVGPFGKTVKDVALILQHMAGRDPLDSTSADLPVPNYAEQIGEPVKGLRIGVPKEYFGEGLDPEVRAAVEAGIQELAKAGCEIVSVSLPHTEYAIPTYYLIATAEASSNLARFDGVRYGVRAKDAKTLAEMYRKTRDAGFGDGSEAPHHARDVRAERRILRCLLLEGAAVRSLLARDFDEAFAKVDAIVTPTTPTPAFKLGEKADDPLAMYLADIYTVTANLVGVPGITVPCGKSKEGLPIGLQILGKHFDEATVLTNGPRGGTCAGIAGDDRLQRDELASSDAAQASKSGRVLQHAKSSKSGSLNTA